MAERFDGELRRELYGLDASFEGDLREIWELVKPHMRSVVEALLARQAGVSWTTVDAAKVDERLRYAEGKLARPIDQAWFDRTLAKGASIAEQKLSFHAVVGGMLTAQRMVHDLITDRPMKKAADGWSRPRPCSLHPTRGAQAAA